MRDGMHLATDVHLPPGPAPFPALVNRTPYGKDGGVNQGSIDRARRWVERGYAVLVQDCRGSGHSEGEYHYYLDDTDDGHDTVEWAAQEPWCTGRVRVFGTSYAANAGYLLAPTQPEGLTAMVMMLGPSNNYLDGRWRGGMWHAARAAYWAQIVEVNTGRSPSSTMAGMLKQLRGKNVHLSRARQTIGRMQGAQGNPLATSFLIDSYRHKTLDDYWRKQSTDDKYDRVTVPTIHVAGMYDQFERGNIQNYPGFSSNPAAGPQVLVLGAWIHGMVSEPWVLALVAAWFDHWMTGRGFPFWRTTRSSSRCGRLSSERTPGRRGRSEAHGGRRRAGRRDRRMTGRFRSTSRAMSRRTR
ncbi:MAG: CocE/NonD family hydrolase [Tepidiformaceae bacterium]